MTGGQIYNEKKKILISLQNRCGGLVIPIFNEIVKIEVYSENLKKNPRKQFQKVKADIKKLNEENHKNVMEKVLEMKTK